MKNFDFYFDRWLEKDLKAGEIKNICELTPK
jgi:hypothetical protein